MAVQLTVYYLSAGELCPTLYWSLTQFCVRLAYQLQGAIDLLRTCLIDKHLFMPCHDVIAGY